MNNEVLGFVDEIEVGLIKLFFNINCLEKILPNLNLIQQLPLEASIGLRKIGVSSFQNIVDFYKFEFKDNEECFWSKLEFVKYMPDIQVDLVMCKVPLDYFWLDYVTDVKFEFEIRNSALKILNFHLSDDLHLRTLELIVKMIFISDCTREGHCKEIGLEWNNLFAELEILNKEVGEKYAR